MRSLLSSTVYIFLVAGLFCNSAISQKCEYNSDGVRSVPFDWSVIQFRGQTVRSIRGNVVDLNLDRVNEVTVVLWRVERHHKVYIGTVVTGDDGYFCFGSQRDGKYEIEAGRSGFQKTTVPIRSSSKSPRESIEIPMEVGY